MELPRHAKKSAIIMKGVSMSVLDLVRHPTRSTQINMETVGDAPVSTLGWGVAESMIDWNDGVHQVRALPDQEEEFTTD